MWSQGRRPSAASQLQGAGCSSSVSEVPSPAHLTVSESCFPQFLLRSLLLVSWRS